MHCPYCASEVCYWCLPQVKYKDVWYMFHIVILPAQCGKCWQITYCNILEFCQRTVCMWKSTVFKFSSGVLGHILLPNTQTQHNKQIHSNKCLFSPVQREPSLLLRDRESLYFQSWRLIHPQTIATWPAASSEPLSVFVVCFFLFLVDV